MHASFRSEQAGLHILQVVLLRLLVVRYIAFQLELLCFQVITRIGQRKGLGLSGGPWFVIRKDVEANVLYVSRGYDTQWQYGREFKIHDFHFITENPWLYNQEVYVTFKIRHTPEFMKGKLIREGENYRIVSSENLQGIAPGQFGVVYDEASRICIGSGEIGV